MNEPESQLRKILELEQRKGFSDRAVMGGLDRFLTRARETRDLPPSSPVMKSIMALPAEGYASLSVEQRRRWASQALALLEESGGESTLDERYFPEAAASAKAREKPQVTRPTPARASRPRPPAVATLDSPITSLRGVSTTIAAKFERLSVSNIRDLLYFFPRRHNDFAQVRRIAELEVGEEQTLVATVWSASETTMGRRLRGTEAVVGDETGTMRIVWFNQPYIAKQLKTNSKIVLAGKVSLYKGQKTLDNPEYEPLEAEQMHTGRLVPVYHLTTGLPSRTARRIVKEALDGYVDDLTEPLPAALRSRLRLPPLTSAVREAHFPDSWEALRAARHRLAFDELLLIQLGVLKRKREWQQRGLARPLPMPRAVLEGYLQSLPFTLTAPQRRALDKTLADATLDQPMSRLLQGDVGSGKTVVAAAALLAAVACGCQGAMMAPTSILAEQHFQTLCRVFSGDEPEAATASLPAPYLSRPLRLALLTGSLATPEKQAIREAVAAGEIDILVGTHAVIQEGVDFRCLGLAVVDEQHRFGVMQRAALREKGANPHMLVMTATPIPRTLALTLYGDLDISVVDELPPGRKPVETRWVPPEGREEAWEFVRGQVQEGRQAFIICPLIEESESLAARAVVHEYERLKEEVFPELRLGLLHGRLGAQKKERVMRDVRDGRLDILVSTIVVEVGVDIPNATVMMVEGAERFGLAQLHQLRGRVGRSDVQSYCLLLSDSPSEEARERLQIVERTSDGFALAEADLELRGPGEFFGTRQSGLPDLRVARLSDVQLIELARREAEALLDDDPDLSRSEHSVLAAEAARVWQRVTVES